MESSLVLEDHVDEIRLIFLWENISTTAQTVNRSYINKIALFNF